MKYCNIGGQAILEGVMMKGPSSYALSVRKPDGEIQVDVTKYESFGEKHKINRVPIVRGVCNFIESLYIGVKTLMDSAEYFEDEEDEADASESKTKSEIKAESESDNEKSSGKKSGKDKDKSDSSDSLYMIGSLVLSIALAVGLFILLPTLLSTLLYKITSNNLIVNIAEGILRLIIFLTYIYAISLMKDIRRTYMYHGAEHKTINCLEAGDDLTVENVKKHTRFHRRCGTSFLFLVILISIIVFMFFNTGVLWIRLVVRLLFIPVIAGLSYEIIRYAGKHENALSRILSAPGLLLQRLTTREPDDDMIEVAIRSVEGVIDWHEYVSCVRNDSFEK